MIQVICSAVRHSGWITTKYDKVEWMNCNQVKPSVLTGWNGQCAGALVWVQVPRDLVPAANQYVTPHIPFLCSCAVTIALFAYIPCHRMTGQNLGNRGLANIFKKMRLKFL